MKKSDPTYESFVPKVKKRDQFRCQGKLGITDKLCKKEHWITKEDGTQTCALRVVRRNSKYPDSMSNLMTVCKNHVPEWEK